MTQSKKWLEAEADCINQRGHLASIHSREELDFIKGEKLLFSLHLVLSPTVAKVLTKLEKLNVREQRV